MNWITGMQKAIDYIEINITDELDYNEIAKISYSSSYHFQRVFSILCGYTLGEYIRNRRLTLAGAELAANKIKVIDAAVKYGYDSPDSFTKAFTKFHGITPSAAREPGVPLRSFARLSIKISLEGGSIMDYRIEEKPEMVLVGHKFCAVGSQTNPDTKHKQTYTHWTTTRKEQSLMKSLRDETNVWYDVYSDFTDEGFNHFIAVKSDIDSIPKGLEKIMIPSCLYAVFETKHQESPDDEWLPLMKRILSEWLPASEYILADNPQINKVYMNMEYTNRYMELWLPIEKILK
ncbi:hypothetical protein SDC9_139536 [bioreactor metagenome]|uniref:HTH araC/xylS-type domain-containing protein n=1 Tax=bioreactor metagenome TaxID=1076179 RepID=A0A645DSV8_9ZZZZ